MGKQNQSAPEQDVKGCCQQRREQERQKSKRGPAPSVDGDGDHLKARLFEETTEKRCRQHEEVPFPVVCKHALFRVEVGPSGKEETQTGGEFKGVRGGEDEEAAWFDDASQLAENAEGVEAVFERFDEENGVECGVREGEGLLKVTANNGHGSLLKAL